MTNTQLIETFAKQLIKRVQYRIDSFGDSYEKAKSVVQMESTAGIKCWLMVDQHFNAVAA